MFQIGSATADIKLRSPQSQIQPSPIANFGTSICNRSIYGTAISINRKMVESKTLALRASAQFIWEAALASANPAACIRRFIQFNGDVLSVAGKPSALAGRLIVIGAGKASAKMAQTVEEIFGGRISGGLVVTKYDHV